MPKKTQPPPVRKKRIVVGSTESRTLLPLPTTLPTYQFEYDGPVIWVPPVSLVTLDFSLANRGTSEESFLVVLTEFHFAADQPSYFDPDTPSLPGRIFLSNWEIENYTSDGEGFWPRIFTNSRDVVPSIHVYGEALDTPPGSVPPSYPEFYVSPGDFWVFERGTPPGFGPVIKVGRGT